MNRGPLLCMTRGGMVYTARSGLVLEVEVVARLELSPGAFDDGQGIILAALRDQIGFVVFVVGSRLIDGQEFSRFAELPAAYVFALELARQHADAFLEACRASVEADDDDPMGTHHGRNE